MLFLTIHDVWFSSTYSALHYPADSEVPFSPLYWLMPLTNLGVLFGFAWIVISSLGYLLKIDILINIAEEETYKIGTFVLVILIGVFFTAFSYPGFIKSFTDYDAEWAQPGQYHAGLPVPLYGALEIFTTSLKHVVIPSVFIFLFFYESKSYKGFIKPKKPMWLRSLILSLIPIIYMIWVVTMTSVFNIKIPYNFLNLHTTDLNFYWIPEFIPGHDQIWFIYLIDMITIIGATGIFCSITYLGQIYWTHKTKKAMGGNNERD